MKTIDELIYNRKSIRKYQNKIPSDDHIKSMIQCAIRAPSPSNCQPIRFINIKSKEIRANLNKALISNYKILLEKCKESEFPKKNKNLINTYFRFSEFMTRAPILLAVGISTKTNEIKSFSKKLLEAKLLTKDTRNDTDLDITTGLSLKGFILKGESLGLGTCILTAPLTFIDNINNIIDEHDIIIKCFITVGYKAHDPSLTKKKPLCEIYKEI